MCKHLDTWNWNAGKRSKVGRRRFQSNIHIEEIVEAESVAQGNSLREKKLNKASENISMAGMFAGRGVSERNQEKVNLKIPEMRNRQAPRGQG